MKVTHKRSTPHRLAIFIGQSLLALIMVYLALRMCRETWVKGNDFKVFYRTANYVLEGKPAYDLVRDKALTFKYPPWILPVFFPFTVMPLAWAKGLWALIQLLSLGVCAYWLRAQRCSWTLIQLVIAAFGGILIVHAMDAQVALPAMALLLIFARPHPLSFWAASIKVFTFLPIVEFFGRSYRHQLRKSLWLTALILLLMSIPVLLTSPEVSPRRVLVDYATVAQSGGKAFRGNKVRSRENQGFPALVLRQLGVSKKNTAADVWVALFIFVLAAGFWYRLSHQAGSAIQPSERWAGWIALTATVQPLAWFHSFAYALPLMALLLNISWQNYRSQMNNPLQFSKARLCLLLSIVSLILICGVTRRTLGPLGYHLELFSIKSWGVLLALVLLHYQKNYLIRK